MDAAIKTKFPPKKKQSYDDATSTTSNDNLDCDATTLASS